ncbi:MAG: glycosyltransferase family 39 protein [Acidimicrobiia bacterium]
MDLTFRGTDPARPEPSDERLVAPSPRPVAPAPRREADRRVRTAVLAALALGVVARFASASDLWLDEVLTVNIASVPLADLPDALRRDGAPPLYYALLHFWMRIFGDSTLAVRALPGLISVTSLPLMWLAARRLGGERLAWAATLLLAAGPFAARYATENRMYSLVTVLVLAGFLALHSLLNGGGRRPALGLAAATGALLLTHYWSFYLLAAVVTFLILTMRRGAEPARSGALRGLVAIAGGGLLFLPWAPVFLYQLRNTGTPWGRPGELRSIFDTVFHFAGGYWNAGILLGLAFFALLALALTARPVDGRHLLVDLRPHPPGSILASVAFGALVLAIIATKLSGSAFAVRYAAVLYPLFILTVALGVDVFTDRRVHATILAVLVTVGFWADVPNVVGNRTNAGRVASELNELGRPGDLVVYCPDQLGPSVSRLVENPELVQFGFPRQNPPHLVDWVDYERVNKSASTSAFARMLDERAGPANNVWIVWAPGYKTYGTKCQNLIERLGEARPDYDRVVTISTRYFERPGLVQFPPAAAG